jgi:hypothetical protein
MDELDPCFRSKTLKRALQVRSRAFVILYELRQGAIVGDVESRASGNQKLSPSGLSFLKETDLVSFLGDDKGSHEACRT